MSKNTMWFPGPDAWLSAGILLLLTGALAAGSQRIQSIGEALYNTSPQFLFLGVILGILSPIIIIAFLHHLIHWMIDRLDSKNTETPQESRGFLPFLMSWWQGLYSWLVLVLTTILSIGIIGMMTSWNNEGYDLLFRMQQLLEMLQDVNKLKHLLTGPAIVWLIVAAYLYQMEHVVRLHWSTVGARKER